MTALSHLDPDFSNVIAIEAVNEPIMNATLTPGYGDCTFLAPLYFYLLKTIMNSPEKFRSSGASSRTHFGHLWSLVLAEDDRYRCL